MFTTDSDNDFDVDDINESGLVTNNVSTANLSTNAEFQTIHGNLTEPTSISDQFKQNLKVNEIYASKVSDAKLLAANSIDFSLYLAKILEVQTIAKCKAIEQQNPLLIYKEWRNKAQSISVMLTAINNILFDKDVQKALIKSVQVNLTPTAESLDDEQKATNTTDEIVQLNQDALLQIKNKMSSVFQV